jgi:thioesterase domain-containing protein
VHAVEGTVHVYDELAEALGPDQPFYAFQSPLLFRNNVYETSIEELSSIYVRELHRIFPSGPYILIGASFGGHVAFEMAKKLYEDGVEPALTLLIDSVVPGSAERVEVQERAASIWRNIQGEGFPYLSRKIKVKIGHLWEKTLWRIRMATCNVYRKAGWRLPAKLRFFSIELAQRAALTRHPFKPYAGKLTVVRASLRDDILRKRDDATLGWKPLAEGEFELHHFPVNHISMLREPAVRSFADLLQRLLPKEASAASASSRLRAGAE